MFCKYCGKAIDPNTMRCRICGREAGPLEGGNGFWDLGAEKEAGTAKQIEADSRAIKELKAQVEALRAQVAERPASAKPGPIPMIAALLAALALGMSIFAVLRSGGTREQQPPEPDTGMVIEGMEEGAEEGSSDFLPSQEEASQTISPAPASGTEKTYLNPANLEAAFIGPVGDTSHTRQSIRVIEQEEAKIFTAIYLGDDDENCLFYWVRVRGDEQDILNRRLDALRFEKLPTAQGDGAYYREDQETDKDGLRHILFLCNGVDEEQLGYYAFIAENKYTHECLVSAIVELYDRDEEKNAPDEETASSESEAEETETGQDSRDETPKAPVG